MKKDKNNRGKKNASRGLDRGRSFNSILRGDKGRREPFPKILIVCEDSKNEPSYFKGLKKHFSLSNVFIEGKQCKQDPLSVVEYADRRYDEEKDFDRVYCVFDRDTHSRFEKALEKSKNIKLENDGFFTIISIPCFEFWILLHYGLTTKEFLDCKDVIRALKKKDPNYSKRNSRYFLSTYNKIDVAVKNAKDVEVENKKNKKGNPSTQVHHLVKYLRNIRK